ARVSLALRVLAPHFCVTVNLTVQDLLLIPFVREIGVSALGREHLIRAVSTDSRTIRQGDLFVALKGPNFDGHKFLPHVRKEGALAAIVSERWHRQATKSGFRRQDLALLVVK